MQNCNHEDENYSDVCKIWCTPWILLSSILLWISSGISHIHWEGSLVVAGLLLEGVCSLLEFCGRYFSNEPIYCFFPWIFVTSILHRVENKHTTNPILTAACSHYMAVKAWEIMCQLFLNSSNVALGILLTLSGGSLGHYPLTIISLHINTK